MKTKKFKITKSTQGFLTFYQSWVKTWWGWRSFVAYKILGGSIFYGVNDREETKQEAFDNIESYRLIKGLYPSEIEIIDDTNHE